MTASNGGNGSKITAISEEERRRLEEIASWDEEKYPISKHAQRILQNLKEESE